MEYFSAMNEVWDEWIEEGYQPTGTCASANLLIKIFVIAVKNNDFSQIL